MASAAPTFLFTKETTNYTRLCRLIVDIGTQALRDTFDAFHPPSTLHKALTGNEGKLRILRARKVINATQWGTLFPVDPSLVSSAHFDITLLMVLLRNLCGLTSPATGWDKLPAETDVRREADIARVKYYRNTVYGHAERASVDPDLEDHYKELLTQWKKDEDNVKDQLNEVIKKLDNLESSVKASKDSRAKEMEQEPIMCKEKYHENEAVQYYCQVCNICICHKCSIVSHNRHAIEDIQRAAEKEKVKMAQVFAKVESQLDVVEARIMRQNEMMEESNEELCAAEDKVTRTVQDIIRIVKEREKAVKAKLTEIKVTQQKMYEAKLDAFQSHAAQLRSCLKYGKSIEKRNSGPEILEGKHDVFGRCEELLTAQDIEIYKPQHVSHFVNADTMNTVEHLVQVIESYTDPSQSSVEGNGLKEAEMGNETDLTVITRDSDGNQRYNEEDRVTVKIRLPKGQNEEMKIEDLQNGKYAVRYKPKSVGLHDIDVEVNGKPLTGSPWRVLVTGHQYTALHSFGSPGEGPGEFNRPDSLVVSERTGNIAIADNGNGRVQLFDSAWKYKRTIGNKGPGAERIRNPRSVAFTASGDVLVIHEEHSQRSKMSLFAENGQFIKHISQQLIDPQRASVRGDGHMIVCDSGNKSVKVLSSDGTRLVQSFGASACDQAPWYAVYHNDKFFVSYASANCVKVFNKGGEFQYDIGEEGSGDGQLKRPAGLAIDNFNNLIV